MDFKITNRASALAVSSRQSEGKAQELPPGIPAFYPEELAKGTQPVDLPSHGGVNLENAPKW